MEIKEIYKKPPFLVLLLGFFVFLPLGVLVFHMAFTKITQPHIFVLLIFSASLAILLALVSFIGLFFNYIYPHYKKK